MFACRRIPRRVGHCRGYSDTKLVLVPILSEKSKEEENETESQEEPQGSKSGAVQELQEVAVGQTNERFKECI